MAVQVGGIFRSLISCSTNTFLRPNFHAPLISRGMKLTRGIVIQDGKIAQAGNIIMIQKRLRIHPGLNVGLGKNGTLYALEKGRVMVTCEKARPNWDNWWIKKYYPGRKGQTIYKKYFHVIPEPQGQRFKLVDQI